MSLFIHLTGGIASPAIAFFLIHILMVTLLLPNQSPYIYVVLAIGAVGVIAWLELTGVLPHYTVISVLPQALHTNVTYVGAQLFFFSIVAFATVFLTANIMQQLRAREKQVVSLLDTAHTVSSTLDLEEVLDRLVRQAAEALSAPGAAIRILDESGERLQVVASFGLSQNYLGKGIVDLSRSKLDQEALSGHVVVVPDALHDIRLQYPEAVAAEGIRSLLVAPLKVQGRALGVLRVYTHRLNAFDNDDTALVMAIAQQGATALQNAIAHNKLQHTDQERAEFVRNITHELRAPVTSTQSLLRALIHQMVGDLTNEQRDILTRIERRFDTLLELINDLLALAASKISTKHEVLEPFDIASVVSVIIENWSIPAAEKHITLRYQSPKRSAFVMATHEGLARIIDNLVGNAVKYTPLGGIVEITLNKSTKGVAVTITDSGIGIPEVDLPNLWNEFFRARNVRSSEITGTGLGLSIVKQLVERYSGIISVQSTEGKGSTFSVRFPIAH
jgi:adenylate cyclase